MTTDYAAYLAMLEDADAQRIAAAILTVLGVEHGDL